MGKLVCRKVNLVNIWEMTENRTEMTASKLAKLDCTSERSGNSWAKLVNTWERRENMMERSGNTSANLVSNWGKLENTTAKLVSKRAMLDCRRVRLGSRTVK